MEPQRRRPPGDGPVRGSQTRELFSPSSLQSGWKVSLQPVGRTEKPLQVPSFKTPGTRVIFSSVRCPVLLQLPTRCRYQCRHTSSDFLCDWSGYTQISWERFSKVNLRELCGSLVLCFGLCCSLSPHVQCLMGNPDVISVLAGPATRKQDTT